jgi:hypothetical protein
MDSIYRFRQSYALLQNFYELWGQRINDRCQGHDQLQAAYYIWARYSMSICTLNALLDPHLIPDLSVICRGCLEFDVALEAVIKYANVASDYLQFEKHAMANYLKILRQQGDIEQLLMRQNQFDEAFGEDPEDFRQKSWCDKHGGIVGLMRKLGRTIDVRLYNMLSHFAHGSVWAMQSLEKNIIDPQKHMEEMIGGVYSKYLGSSRRFVVFIWEPLITAEGEQCKNDFIEVEASIIHEITGI